MEKKAVKKILNGLKIIEKQTAEIHALVEKEPKQYIEKCDIIAAQILDKSKNKRTTKH